MFTITLTQKGEGFTPSFHHEVKGDNLLEVIAQFILVIALLHKKLLDEAYQKRVDDDDIPF
jgi:hypothetical protein